MLEEARRWSGERAAAATAAGAGDESGAPVSVVHPRLLDAEALCHLSPPSSLSSPSLQKQQGRPVGMILSPPPIHHTSVSLLPARYPALYYDICL